MTELDDLTRELLAELRADASPGEAVSKTVWSRVRARIEPGGGGGGEGAGGDAGLGPEATLRGGQAAKAAFAAKVVGATAMLTGAGLLVLKLGAMAVHELSADPARDEPTRVEVEVEAEAEAEPPDPVEPQPELAPKPAPTGDHELANAPPDPAAPRERSSSRRGRDDEQTRELGIEAELALIRAARASASARKTIELLEQHRERFPDGLLADEREVLRIEANCELGRIEEARRIAAELSGIERSPLRARVHASCAAKNRESP